MRIAQIAPLAESVPPRLYGGTERIVSYLTEELVRQGHEVTLFASGDSRTSAKLVPGSETALRLAPNVRDPWPNLIVMLDQVRRQAGEFDLLHFHIDYFHFPLYRDIANRTLTTLHGRLDLPEYQPLYRAFPEMPVATISHCQGAPLPPVNWMGTVHHGLPLGLLRFEPGVRRSYLAFLGRMSPEKRPDRAIEIALRTGIPIRIAAKVDRADQDYFEARIRPLLQDPLVEFVGELGEADKGEFLSGAIALLFLVDWPEPFGLVMIEAMACGTPTIAWRCGSVPEILEPGLTGFIVDSMEKAAAAVGAAATLDPAAIRRRFELRFSAERMARDYLRLYHRLKAASDYRAAEDQSMRPAASGRLGVGKALPSAGLGRDRLAT